MRPWKTAVFVVASAVALAPLSEAVEKVPAAEVDAWVRDAALVVHARAIAVEGTRGQFAVLRVLKGSTSRSELNAGSVRTQSCIGPDDGVPFPAGTEVVLFLGSQEKEVFPVVGRGFAWIQLAEQRRTEILAGVGKVIEFESLASPELRMKAYLAALEDGNPCLRGFAHFVITSELHGKVNAAPWETLLVPLLRSPVVEARRAAIHALKFSRSESALPALLDALGDDDKTVREESSMALSPYDTEATVRALIGAAKGKEMVPRVIIDLRNSRRPEAREFLVGFLKSEDPKLREMAARSFYTAVFEGDPVILELHRLAADPDHAVRVSAIESLHKSPLAETVGVLLGVLRRERLTPRELRAAYGSLGHVVETLQSRAAPGGFDNVRELKSNGVGGSVQKRAEGLQELRDARDLPALMQRALQAAPEGNLPRLGSMALGILFHAGTEEATALLQLVKDGEFGPELVEGATRALDRMAAR